MWGGRWVGGVNGVNSPDIVLPEYLEHCPKRFNDVARTWDMMLCHILEVVQKLCRRQGRKWWVRGRVWGEVV